MMGCKTLFAPGPVKSQLAWDVLQRIRSNSIFLYTDLQSSDDKSFIKYSYLYRIVSDEIDSVRNTDSVRKKNTRLIQQDQLIKTIWNEYIAEHKDKVSIQNSEAHVYQIYFTSVVDPRIVSENSLKH